MQLFIVPTLVIVLAVAFCAAKPTDFDCYNPTNCFMNPCKASSCDAYPNAKCVADTCDGCIARWFLAGKFIDCYDEDVAMRSAVASKETKCQTVYCFVDPCAFAKCEKHPEAVCKANYCGGCNAWFYLGNERVSCN